MDISGHVLVVGGGSGIGRATALMFAKTGAAGIMIADINIETARNVAAECKNVGMNSSLRVDAVYMDITDETSVDAALRHIGSAFGTIDHCVVTAGVGLTGAIEIADMDVAEFKRVIDVNVTGSFIVTRAMSAFMRQTAQPTDKPSSVARGTIVLMGSGQSFVPFHGMTQYTTAKHAVLGLAKNAAMDNVKHGIRVNCVCPSWVATPMVTRLNAGTPGLEDMINRVVPAGRMASPEEVADAIVFLSSPRSSYVTGISFVVDGGTLLQLRL
ncbi:NAD(P)-binding protein [Xylaria sp. FL1042]|nr:NAD(P)-binding protein [Xylaria sp. FL1042]